MYVRNKFTVHNHCNNRVHVNWPLSHDLDLFGFVLVPDRSPFRVMLVRSGRGAAELLLVRRFTNHDFSLSDARTTLLFSPPTKLSFTRLLCRIYRFTSRTREKQRVRVSSTREKRRDDAGIGSTRDTHDHHDQHRTAIKTKTMSRR